MPDGAPTPTEPITGERAADIADAGLIRRVRRNLVLWSGGTTLVVLLVLAVALYLAVAGSLANSGVEQLQDAMAVPRAVLTGQRPDPGDTSPVRVPARVADVRVRARRDRSRHRRAARLPDAAGPARRRRGRRGACERLGPAHGDRRHQRRPGPHPDRGDHRAAGRGRHGPGRPGPLHGGADAPGDAGRAARRRRRGRAGRVRLRHGLCPPGAGPHPRVPGQPAVGAAPAARLRGRCQPRAPDPADGRPQQRRAPQPPPGPAGPRGRLGARRHRCRGPPHDGDGRGSPAAGALRLRGGRPRPRAGGPRRRRRGRRLGAGQAGGRWWRLRSPWTRSPRSSRATRRGCVSW